MAGYGFRATQQAWAEVLVGMKDANQVTRPHNQICGAAGV